MSVTRVQIASSLVLTTQLLMAPAAAQLPAQRPTTRPPTVSPEATLRALPGERLVSMGAPLKIFGDRLIAGAPLGGYSGDCDRPSGAFVVYERQESGDWVRTVEIIGDGTEAEYYGSLVDIDGTGYVFGSSYAYHNNNRAGAACLVDPTFSECFSPDCDCPYLGFGSSSAMFPEFVVIGNDSASPFYTAGVFSRHNGGKIGSLPGHDVAGSGERLVLSEGSQHSVYDCRGALPVYESELPSISTYYRVAIDGHRAAIVETASNQTLVFEEKSPGVWTQTGRIAARGALSLSGDLLAIGGQVVTGPNGESQGAVSLYWFDGNEWLLAQHVVSPDPRENEHFGVSVSLHSGRLAVGAPNDCYTAPESRVFVFTLRSRRPCYDAPKITQAPADVTACVGERVTFSVTATSPSVITYQWQKDGVALTDDGRISGVHLNVLVIEPFVLQDFGHYECTVGVGVCSEVVGATATLLAAPTIDTQPDAAGICLGEDFALHVGARSDTTLRYQWRRDGIALVDGPEITGATTADLEFTELSAHDFGTYDVLVSDDCSEVLSAAVLLDQPASSGLILAQPQSVTDVCPGAEAAFEVLATDAEDVMYRWFQAGVPLLDDGRVTGASSARLKISPIEAQDFVAYTAHVFSSCAYEISASAAIAPTITAIISSPTSQTLCRGRSATLHVDATGCNAYEWKHRGLTIVDGVHYLGARTDTLTIANVGTADAGAYTAIVTGLSATLTTPPAIMTIASPPVIATQPADTIVAEGYPAQFQVVPGGEPDGLVYQWRHDGQELSDSADVVGAQSSQLLVLAASLADVGVYSCIVSDATMACDTTSDAAELILDTGCGSPELACNRSDIAPVGAPDCVVELADVGLVLAFFAPGVPGNMRDNGDVWPAGVGDGFVDLRDLGQMLSDFGADCR